MIQLLLPIMRGPFFILLGVFGVLVFSEKVKIHKNEEQWERFIVPRKKMLINTGVLLIVLGVLRLLIDVFD